MNYSDQQIVDSWRLNVSPWTTAVRANEIESRVVATNQAIIDSVMARSPKTVLDVGCGEGWLVRALSGLGVASLGIDVVLEFIVAAQEAGAGRFRCLSYEDFSYEAIGEKFDVVVCNFSLLGNESVARVFRQVSSLLNAKGSFIVQTVHPLSACGDEEYVDGWRPGTWDGFSDEFTKPAPWYFRTMESWKGMFMDYDLRLTSVTEPFNPKTSAPASVIFVAENNE